jgi:hypothetical protein
MVKKSSPAAILIKLLCKGFSTKLSKIFTKNYNFLSILSLKTSIFKKNFACGADFLFYIKIFQQKIEKIAIDLVHPYVFVQFFLKKIIKRDPYDFGV